jgi:hypothetical protein
MTLTDVEKEILGFLYTHIGSSTVASMAQRELQNNFAEVSTDDFQQIVSELTLKNLIVTNASDEISFTADGSKIGFDLQGRPVTHNLRQPISPNDRPAPENEHLVWDLSRLSDFVKANRFVMGFRTSLCVYSPPVEQLYTNYDLVVPKDNERKLIILPNPHAAHDTFNHINADAIVPTNVFITPTAEGKLQLMLPMKGGRWHLIALARGLNALQEKLGADDPFLPVISKGDLRELSPSRPMLHLHRIILKKVQRHSDMEIRAIRRVIQGNLTEHYGFNPSTAAPSSPSFT